MCFRSTTRRVFRCKPRTRFLFFGLPSAVLTLTGADARHARGVVGILLLFFILFASTTAAADELDRVAALAKGGASNLALRLIDSNQPSPDKSEAWMAWEKERFAILAERHDWDQIAQRADTLPKGLPDDFVQWAWTRAAWARLSANDGTGARSFLRRLLWQERGAKDALEEWRQMVIRSYLVDNDLADAQTAIARYEVEFDTRSDDWSVLSGTILLRSNRNGAAMAVLAGVQTYEGRLLRLLAGLRSGNYKPAVVLARAIQLAHDTVKQPALERQAWILAARAAGRAKNAAQQLAALERALNFPASMGYGDPLFQVNADDLWHAYDTVATNLGNKYRLLVGDDAAWLKKAAAYKHDFPPYARAFYAFLAFHGDAPKTRDFAQAQLAESLYADGNERVVRALYTRSSRYQTLADVPDQIRYLMTDRALSNYDIAFAGQLMQGLNDPPPGEDVDEWSMRRARVLVYAGDFKSALTLLQGVLQNKTQLDDDFVEHYLQVIFDLQAADKNREAESLLKTLFPLVQNPEIQRQILFWMGDSKTALREYTSAAEFYLRSATYNNSTGGDMWGKTARFHAAEALAKAGLIDDARNIYQHLLRVTQDPKRRAFIERNIQMLWLLDAKNTKQ